MGASFPLAADVVVRSESQSGARIGRLYAVNTMGAILGASGAGFVLLPLLGMQTTLMVAVAINLGTAALLGFGAGRSAGRTVGRTAAVGGLASLALILVWQPSWNRQRMTSGPYAYAHAYQNVTIDQRLEDIELLFYEEGPVSTVSVIA
jgi:spermidine synthase